MDVLNFSDGNDNINELKFRPKSNEPASFEKKLKYLKQNSIVR